MFGTDDEPSSRRPPSGFVLLAVGLVIGMAVGVLFTPSDAPNIQLTEPPVTTASQFAAHFHGVDRTYEPGTIIGLRTCRAANHVVATYQSRLEGTGVTLSNGWMAPSPNTNLESWWFVSALVSGGSSDGQVATWALPGFGGGVDAVNTPNLSFPANEVSQSFDFGDRRFTPDDYGVADWLDLDGAIASQQCVTISNDR